MFRILHMPSYKGIRSYGTCNKPDKISVIFVTEYTIQQIRPFISLCSIPAYGENGSTLNQSKSI